MFLRVLAAMAGLMLLCSCNTVAFSGTESLLAAPKLNKRQSEVSKALESTLLISSIIYRYPQGGEYRAPFIFYDLDGDSKDEAIVFYSYASEPSSVRIKFFSQNDDRSWSPFYDITSQSSQVEFVRFHKLIYPHSDCMVIGWRGAGRRPSSLAVYSKRDGVVKIEANLEYMSYAVLDYGNDGLSRLAIVGQENDRFYAGLFRGMGGYIELAGKIDLALDVNSILKLTTGKLWDGNYALYIDESLGGGPAPTTATEIIRVTDGGLTFLSGGEEAGGMAAANYSTTFRSEEILCMDVDNDGTVEVPYPVLLPGVDEETSINAPRLINFMNVSPEGFNTRRSGVMNTAAGYIVYFPDRWKDTVTVEVGLDTGEWHFRKWNPVAMEPAEELLRIRVTSTKDYLDRFEDYTELDKRGVNSYTAYIPAIPGEALAVTEQEVKRMFTLIG